MACVSRVSEEDLKVVAMMERAGVLQPVLGNRLPTRNGAILLFCGDADQAIDLLQRSFEAIFTEGDLARPHLLADNGGALLLPRESPLYQACPSRGENFLDSFKESRQLKGIDTLVLEAHVPCGKAEQFGLSLDDVVRLLKMAKVRVLEEIPDMTVACFIHIDRNGAGKSILFLDGAQWRKWEQLTPEDRERRYGDEVSVSSGGEAYEH